MFTQILLPKTASVLEKLKHIQALSGFYLSGGTALALQIGHRESEDLDFFSQSPFDPTSLQTALLPCGTLENTELSEGTLNTYIDGVKLQFLLYPYAMIEQTIPWEGVSLSSVVDIACTKIMTVSTRGNKKDFIDMYFLLHMFTLDELMQNLKKKYQNVSYNDTHILKSLVYFEDANAQPMPRMHKDVSWENVKQYIAQIVAPFA